MPGCSTVPAMKTPYGPGIRQAGESALPPVHTSDAEPGPDLLPGHPLLRRRRPLIPVGFHTSQKFVSIHGGEGEVGVTRRAGCLNL